MDEEEEKQKLIDQYKTNLRCVNSLYSTATLSPNLSLSVNSIASTSTGAKALVPLGIAVFTDMVHNAPPVSLETAPVFLTVLLQSMLMEVRPRFTPEWH